MQLHSTYLSPPHLYNVNGQKRTVGFEIEIGEISLDDAAHAVEKTFGGTCQKVSTFYYKVVGTCCGDFSVEIDSGLLTNKKFLEPLRAAGISLAEDSHQTLETTLLKAFSLVVPIEISCPPIPVDELNSLTVLQAELKRRGAKGTKAALLYAFGLHINPEAHDLSVDSLCATMQSFLLLYPWIAKRVNVDLARKISPFITPFPDSYTKKILQASYKPTLESFIDDYLEDNATRNRPLDLLPLLAYLDEAKIRSSVGPEHKVRKRPTFHYRMPNCSIDQQGWEISQEWNTWVAVETLAADQQRLSELIGQYQRMDESVVLPFFDPWPEFIEKYIPE